MRKSDLNLFINKVGARIKELRLEQDLTQLDLAIKSNVDERQIQRLENGETSPTLKTLYKVSHGLNVPIEQFFKF